MTRVPEPTPAARADRVGAVRVRRQRARWPAIRCLISQNAGTGQEDQQGPDELALAEYRQIKSEQVARIGFRDNLMYVTLVAIAGTLTITHSAHSRGYLLLVPAVSFVLGWTYLVNDHMITAIGRYVREHPALSAMRWETSHLAGKRRASRKAIQLAVDLAAFCGSAVTALIAFWAAPDPQSPFLVLASVAEAIATGVLAWQFAAYAGLSFRSLRSAACASRERNRR